jgi:hypothetical protein
LIEIPPVPVGAGFAVCLTHDVDHPVLRNHRWDHTAFGFLWRATFGSLLSWVRGGMSFKHLCSNWTAAGTLPFVYLGWAKDPWAEFDRYLAIEDGLGSTFFVIPHRDDPGQTRQGHAPDRRAASYSLADIKSQLSRIQSAGCEVGVHGIDAWMDPGKGRAETRQVLQLTGDSKTGIRMHWLYFDEQSPAALDEAGFQYDSTFGYNGTVGYRAGTTQVFKPLMAKRLLELPLHVMDTALFYPGHLHLDEKRARDLVSQLIENAARFGGVLTVNWHDRSIAPERLWGDFYLWLLEELKRRGAWFPTATQAVAWFQKRRSVVFEEPVWEEGAVRIKASADADEALPGLQLRVYGLRDPAASAASAGSSPSVIKLEFDGNLDTRIEFAERLACA